MMIAFARLGGAVLAAFMIPALAATSTVPVATVAYDKCRALLLPKEASRQRGRPPSLHR